jgi:hypothetical protein
MLDQLYFRIVPITQVVIDHKMIFNQQENIENLFILPYQEIFFTFCNNNPYTSC